MLFQLKKDELIKIFNKISLTPLKTCVLSCSLLLQMKRFMLNAKKLMWGSQLRSFQLAWMQCRRLCFVCKPAGRAGGRLYNRWTLVHGHQHRDWLYVGVKLHPFSCSWSPRPSHLWTIWCWTLYIVTYVLHL